MENISKRFDVCGIGMSTIDSLQLIDDFPSSSGVTEVIESRLMGGGPVPTALCTAAKLGAKAVIVDRVGDDWSGRLTRDEYDSYGVNTESLRLEADKTTTFACVLVRKNDGERHVVFSPGDFSPLESHELPIEVLRSSKILHLNGRHWPACLEAAALVREAGGLVSFDGGANRYDPKFDELLAMTDIAIVARDFAQRFSGSEDQGDQLAALVGCGVAVAAITDGENGSWFATSEGEVFHQAAFKVSPVVDTTGCGDAFHGGFLFAYGKGWSLRESATFASAVAAINAKALGGRGNLPALGEVAELIQAR